MKEAVMKVIDMLTQEVFHGTLHKLLEWCNKCLAAGGDYFEGDKSFMSVLSIKVPIRKKSGNLFNDPHIYKCVCVFVCLCVCVCVCVCVHVQPLCHKYDVRQGNFVKKCTTTILTSE